MPVLFTVRSHFFTAIVTVAREDASDSFCESVARHKYAVAAEFLASGEPANFDLIREQVTLPACQFSICCPCRLTLEPD